MQVDCTRWITSVPDSLAPICLRTSELAPSQPTRNRARRLRGVPVSASSTVISTPPSFWLNSR
jgi:hypothetical protein